MAYAIKKNVSTVLFDPAELGLWHKDKGPHTDAQGHIPRDIQLHTRESKVTSCLDDVSRTLGQGLSLSHGKVLDPMGVLGL